MYKPSYLQKTAAECGIACVGFVAAHYRKVYTLTQLRSLLSVASRGSTLLDLVTLARRMGFQSRAVRVPFDSLHQLMLPAILHWDGCHFVVLTKIKNRQLHLHDPARGRIIMGVIEAKGHFAGVALELTPSDEFAQPCEIIQVGWRMLVGRIHGLKRSLGQLVYLAAVLQLVVLMIPLFTQWTVDNAIVNGDLELLYVLLVGLSLCLLTKVFLEAARGWLSIIATTQFSSQWGTRVVSHLLRLPSQWFEVRQIGDVISRFQSMQSIQNAVTGRLVDLVLDGAFSLVILIVLLIYSPPLAAVVLLAMAMYAIVRTIPHGKFHRINDEALVHDAKAQSHFLENLRAIQVIKLAGLEALRTAQWTALTVEAINKRAITQRMTLAFGSGYGIIFAVESIAILGVGASKTIDGTLTVGMLMAFITYKDEFSTRVKRLIDNLMGIRMLRLHSERLGDIVLSRVEAVVSSTESRTPGTRAALLEIEALSFRYGENLPWVIKDLSISIGPGEHVAIVGPTGCGKTTLAKIILGLLEPTSGVIKLDGRPLSQHGLSAWRNQVAAVMQDDQLFSGSLFENISCFNEDLTLEDVKRAANLASVDSEIACMPMGYNTLNGDMGSSLSGGQKQRILLARAICRRPALLVLDEATSHLDPETEMRVNLAIRSLNTTRVTIAHRPETIASADRIVSLV